MVEKDRAEGRGCGSRHHTLNSKPGEYLDLHTRNAEFWLCGWLTGSFCVWKLR